MKWEWMSDNSACFAGVSDECYRRHWEASIDPTRKQRGSNHFSRRGPFKVEVMTCDLDCNVLQRHPLKTKYHGVSKARAAAIRLLRRVKKADCAELGLPEEEENGRVD